MPAAATGRLSTIGCHGESSAWGQWRVKTHMEDRIVVPFCVFRYLECDARGFRSETPAPFSGDPEERGGGLCWRRVGTYGGKILATSGRSVAYVVLIGRPAWILEDTMVEGSSVVTGCQLRLEPHRDKVCVHPDVMVFRDGFALAEGHPYLVISSRIRRWWCRLWRRRPRSGTGAGELGVAFDGEARAGCSRPRGWRSAPGIAAAGDG